MKRRDTLARLGRLSTVAALPAWMADAAAQKSDGGKGAGADSAATGQRVLRYAILAGETGFDPAQINDNTSRTITSHIFESLYCYDHLARPPRIVPLVADGEPVAEDQFKRWTFKVRAGIYFADDPAFNGPDGRAVKRELVAADFLYMLKRFADPILKSPLWASMENLKILGLAELRKDALDKKAKFDYDRPIEGMKLLDRHTFQLQLAEPRPRLKESMSVPDLFGGVADGPE